MANFVSAFESQNVLFRGRKRHYFEEKSESEKAAACAMFDAFCKEVIRNAMIDYLRKNKHIVLDEMPVAEPELISGLINGVEDIYSTEHLFIKYCGCSYVLDNDTLHQAMCSLEKHLLQEQLMCEILRQNFAWV